MKSSYNVVLLCILIIILLVASKNLFTTIRYNKRNDMHQQKNVDEDCNSFTQYGVLENKVWNPLVCSLHKYTTPEFQECMNNRAKKNNKINHLVFIGDSVMRQKFLVLQTLLLGQPTMDTKFQKDYLLNDTVTPTKIEFRWKPEGFESLAFVQSWDKLYTKSKPDFVFINFAGWHLFTALKNGEDVTDPNYIDVYKNEVKAVTDELAKHLDTTEVIWGHTQPINETRIKERPKDSRNWISAFNQYDTKYPTATKSLGLVHNEYAAGVINDGIKQWNVFYQLGKYFTNDTKGNDGVHCGKDHLYNIEIILSNYLCNSLTNHEDGTCCQNIT